MKKRFLAFLIGSLFLLASCDAGQVGEPVSSAPEIVNESFVLARVSDEKLNPLTVTNNTNKQLLTLAYDGLISVNAEFEAETMLADFVKNGRDVVFTIKPGAVFWDGTAVTAADAEYSYRLASAYGSPYSERFRYITGYKASGARFTVTMASDNPANVNLCDIPIIKAGTESAEFPVGSGRYTLNVENGEVYMQANQWWIGGIKESLPRIDVRHVADKNSLQHSFNAGSVKAVHTDVLNNNSVYKGDIRHIDYDTTTLAFLGVNCTRPYLAEGRVRNALSQSIKRSLIANDTLIKKALPSWTVFSPAWAEIKRADIPQDIYAPEAAMQTLADCGFVKGASGFLTYGGIETPLYIIVDSSNAFKAAVADAVAKDFVDLGFNVWVNKLATADYRYALDTLNFDFYIGEIKFCGNMDVSSLADGGVNKGRFDPALITAPLNDYFAGGDLAAAITAIHDQSPVIPLYYKKEGLAVTRKLSDGLLPVQESIFNNLQNCSNQK